MAYAMEKNFGLSKKQINKIRAEATEASAKNIEEKDKKRKQRQEAQEDLDEIVRQAKLINDSATVTNSREIAKPLRGSQTPAGDNLPHGDRGGRLDSGKGFRKIR